MGTNKPDPKKPNHTLLEVRSKKSSEDYILILDIPGKHVEYREDEQMNGDELEYTPTGLDAQNSPNH